MAYLKKEYDGKWKTFPRTYMQAWRYAFAMNTAPSQQIVSLAIDNGEISSSDLELFKFLKTVRFATASQIGRLFSNLGKNPLEVEKYLAHLISDRYLNAFALSDTKIDHDWIKDPDALVIYSLDFGGKFALIYDGEDMADWYSYSNRMGIKLVSKYLLGTDMYISLIVMPLTGNLVDFQAFPPFFVNNKSAEVDYTLTYRNNNQDTPLIVYISESGLEGIELAKKMRAATELLHSTKTWNKYFPLQENPPKILIILDELSKVTLSNAYRTVHQASKFSSEDVFYTDTTRLHTRPFDSDKNVYRLKPKSDKTIGVVNARPFSKNS